MQHFKRENNLPLKTPGVTLSPYNWCLFVQKNLFEPEDSIPCSELPYPTLKKGPSSSKMHWVGDHRCISSLHRNPRGPPPQCHTPPRKALNFRPFWGNGWASYTVPIRFPVIHRDPTPPLPTSHPRGKDPIFVTFHPARPVVTYVSKKRSRAGVSAHFFSEFPRQQA